MNIGVPTVFLPSGLPHASNFKPGSILSRLGNREEVTINVFNSRIVMKNSGIVQQLKCGE